MVRVTSATDSDCIGQAVAALKAGGLVCYPTDTVYGIGAPATDEPAVRRLFAVKGRPAEQPLPLLLADEEEVGRVAAEVPPLARALMRRFWPGGLTIVLRKADGFESVALAGGDTVAVRVPDQPLVREIIRRCGAPVTGTSANRSGEKSLLTAGEVRSQLGEGVDLIIDGGRCPGGVESTVVDISGPDVKILRDGAVRREELEAALRETAKA
ncbi:MAG: threonylcarbamoyl-AMP synthase [Chloroflexi bacterium]|nr:threonylcarbamoyl-AMP synthase [Chloroflexota bacterium]